MFNKLFVIPCFFVLFLNSCTPKQDNRYTSMVNLFIGSQGDGNTFPGVSLPFGGVQLSPDTRMAHGSYSYLDHTLFGFSHTHLNGVGEPEYCDILFMPTVGEVRLHWGEPNQPGSGYLSTFSHQDEIAIPGYYSVLLKDYRVKAELTATMRAGFHKYTFPKSEESHVIIDLAYPFGAELLNIRKVSDTEIEGLRRSHGWAWDQYVYFVARFSKPFSSLQIAVDEVIKDGLSEASGKNIKAVVNFRTSDQEEILVKVGLSAVSAEGARKNLDAEIPDWNFAGTRKLAEKAWNKELGKIDVEGGTHDEQVSFYTSMYHAFLSPDIFMDVDGRYRGIDHKIHQAEGFNNYTVFSLWDTFRALHPLFTIVQQERSNDFIQSLLQMYRDGGRLPMWPLAGNYTDDMLGYHAVPVIVDAYMKGIRGYDAEEAFKAICHSAQLDKLGLKYYKKIGYLPYDRQGESVSKTLEYCYDDWCIAQMAKAMGKDKEYHLYHQGAHFYENVFDQTVGFMRGRAMDRSWYEPFDPFVNSAYSEGNAWQYMFVPHDVEGLISLMGGDSKFNQWLDSLFSMKSDKKWMIGEYAHGNEPSHHLAYMYNYSGEAWKTQQIVRRILTEMYLNKPEGLSGNEDCGQMSGWYILSAMGFYSVAPGQEIYVIGSPLFEKATINLENGKKFIIHAKNNSDKNIYIQSATLNGKPYSKSYIRHNDIVNGGELVFEMGSSPNKSWGTAKEDRPYSENGDPVIQPPYIKSGDTLFMNATTITLACDTKNSTIRYTLDGADPDEKSTLYTKPFEVKGTTILKMISFDKDSKPGNVVTYKLDKAVLNEPVVLPAKKHGLNYLYYDRFFVSAEDLDIVQPESSGVIESFTIAKRPKETYFGYKYSGYIYAPQDGIYTFYLASNDGSRLYIDDKEIVENDANHAAIVEPGNVALKAGLHRIVLNYFQCGGGKGLKLEWSGPGVSRREVSPNDLFIEN